MFEAVRIGADIASRDRCVIMIIHQPVLMAAYGAKGNGGRALGSTGTAVEGLAEAKTVTGDLGGRFAKIQPDDRSDHRGALGAAEKAII